MDMLASVFLSLIFGTLLGAAIMTFFKDLFIHSNSGLVLEIIRGELDSPENKESFLILLASIRAWHKSISPFVEGIAVFHTFRMRELLTISLEFAKAEAALNVVTAPNCDDTTKRAFEARSEEQLLSLVSRVNNAIEATLFRRFVGRFLRRK
jgi:hypothetical protein